MPSRNLTPPPLQVFLLNLPEVSAAHSHLGVPTVTARFGTAPGIWNGAMAAVAALPQSVRGGGGKGE